MTGDEGGQITVFLACMFFIICTAAFCILEGVRGYMGVPLMEDALIGAGDEILANYDRSLFARYHVFFLDPRERTHILPDGRKYLENFQNKNNFYNFSCQNLVTTDEKRVIDEEGSFLKHQIWEWMKYQEIKSVANGLKRLFQSAEDADRTAKEKKRDLSAEEFQYGKEHKGERDLPSSKVEENQEVNTREKINWKNLKEMLGLIMRSGILFYVIEDSGSISSAGISSDKLPSVERGKTQSEEGAGKEGVVSFTNLKSWRQLLDSANFKNIMMESDDILMMNYIFRCFGSYNTKGDETGVTALQYEIEYLIGGKDSDLKNLRYAANQILLLRFLGNVAWADTDADIQTKAAVMSAGLTGFLGFPEAQGIVKNLLVLALCYGESLLDVHALFKGEEIPVIKSKSTWNLSFENAAILLREKATVKKGKWNVGYDDYLKLLLGLRIHSDTLCYRMMDLMQMNVALDEPGFRMADCLYSFCWTADFQRSWYFPGFSFSGIRSQGLGGMKIERWVSY